MDQGIIKSFKAHYCAKYIQHAIDRYDCGITPSQIYDINQLEAMQYADEAWDNVDVMMIRHCWHKAGILPNNISSFTPSLPISALVNPVEDKAEKMVKDTLDRLELTGVLQSSN
ncbi:hypothetical protein APHAL10511_008651 [Amanita phalloides]|nr:hypothetical protein APHAL10511_008651 [Amanita phalloides]